jgi:hypothetical protein
MPDQEEINKEFREKLDTMIKGINLLHEYGLITEDARQDFFDILEEMSTEEVEEECLLCGSIGVRTSSRYGDMRQEKFKCSNLQCHQGICHGCEP